MSKTFLHSKGLANRAEHHEVRMLCNMISRGWQVECEGDSEGDEDEMRSVKDAREEHDREHAEEGVMDKCCSHGRDG